MADPRYPIGRFQFDADRAPELRAQWIEDLAQAPALLRQAVAGLNDRQLPVDSSLALVEGLHQRWVALLRSLRPDDFARTFQHPETGEQSLDRLVAFYAWHGKHHAAHIRSLRERMGW